MSRASARRAWWRDVERRRCPTCRNRGLTGLGPDLVWCENCGKTGPVVEFPYQQYWVDHVNYMAERAAARSKKEGT